MKKPFASFLLVLLLLPLFIQCAAQQDVVTLDSRLRKVDANSEAVSRELDDFRRQAAERSSVETVQKRQAEVGELVDRVNAEILRLNGQMDESSRQNRQFAQDFQNLKNQLNTRAEEQNAKLKAYEERLATLEAELEQTRQSRMETASERAKSKIEEAGKAKTTSAEMAKPRKIEPTGAKMKPGESDAAAPTAEHGDTRAQAQYDSALELYKAGRYTEAYDSFTGYVAQYPQGKMVANARFWLGDCRYKLQEYELAILEYQKVIADYPNHDKAAAALLKQGLSFEQLKDPDTAKIIYNKILSDFPKSDQAETAKKQLEKLK